VKQQLKTLFQKAGRKAQQLLDNAERNTEAMRIPVQNPFRRGK